MFGIKPAPLQTSLNAVHDYEGVMTDTNRQLISTLFSEGEIDNIKRTKGYIEEAIPDWAKSNAYVVVAGGCFASHMQFEKVKDIDIFVLGHSDPEEQTRRHEAIRRKMIFSFLDIVDKTQDYVRNNDAVKEVWTDSSRKIQFIYTNHKSRQELIADFDYVHCMTSYHLHKLYITRQIYDAIVRKELIVNNPKNVQEWRRNKFLNRGYKEVGSKEHTLGDILAGALKKVAQTSYVSYEDDDAVPAPKVAWGPYRTNIAKNV